LIRNIRFCFPLLLCLNAGCQAESAKGDEVAPSAELGSAEKGAAETPGPVTGKIDPDPVPTNVAMVVSKSDIKVDGKPACDFVIRYPNTIDQNVTWNGEGCDAIEPGMISVDELKKAGQFEGLAEEAKEDLIRNPGKKIFYIESEFTASVYPLNVAGVVYEVPIAD
jgi:hypothetical protein